ncbi:MULTISPECIES: phosphoribosylformylglycinamidine cyclo-ligase [Clostridium]|uniref:Phosphoribosylformylglycinamidine cyclo-ligase n=1 Tax=Clostridium cadaveris TaxID=1529 RepID=A0A1I2J2F7_9CLOT|nr:phosphoribosylformylglycinamidine cyclo-ligase [Clostridium cadaveris]MDU4951546.1 phosphoribosylformylglycinamidine cyclo-ligase [Clostridium sp.]MDM8311365.1 phosphoribosylformylglycinamidine cyclo-ligase [Clostridium cadaveris]MDY4950517.1 phosphoribosylformylglycinamidine cyclo-ligase [Clostridium cadaveris]NME63273.1 phosphoribosylformylglycinamidine cyclo-ligase [Clostridium cadaveris]PWL52826.1 MAG: phosphoribosylformylglycinamidine cyclo-ligase [Clostridium cadaveris]
MITYKDAGVNIEEGYRAVDLIKGYAKSTMNPLVLNHIGSFGAMMELPEGYKKPVLISGTDGVGTKLEIAFKMNKYDTVGIDCVAMCVNDILCHGAQPLFFLDYIACGKLEANVASDIVKGVADGCLQSGSALVGGETAEMPGFYPEGEYDIAGFSVGIVDKDKIIDGHEVEEGDVIIGLPSSGVHSNGYSLVRKIVTDLDEKLGDKTLGEILLTPTRIYVKPIQKLMEKFKIKAMCHITGGGFIENVPRMLPKNKTAVILKDSYEIPEIFKYMMNLGVEKDHMYNTFNMGIGFMVCIDKSIKDEVLAELQAMGEKAYEIGYITCGEEGVCLK